LNEKWEIYTNDRNAPLLNRVFFGYYPIKEVGEQLSGYLMPEVNLISDMNIRLVGLDEKHEQSDNFYLNPFQAALISSAISNLGEQPAPRIVSAVNTQKAGWVPLDLLSESNLVFSNEIIEFKQKHTDEVLEDIWQLTFSIETQNQAYVTWYWGGIQSRFGNPSISIALLLEEKNIALAEEIGRKILLESFDKK